MLWMYADPACVPEKIGSIRSARHYYIQIAQGYDAIFVHWGGSPYAYAAISENNIDDLDGMSSGKYFKRDKTLGRALEHTGYTGGELINAGIAAKEFRTQIGEAYTHPFDFAAQRRSLPGGICQTLRASFSADYSYTYRYNETDGLYYSYLNDSAFTDSEGVQQSFTNVIFIYAPVSSLDDAKARVTVNFDGGSGIYASNGSYESISWAKGGDTDLLRFTASDGSALQLNPGRTYIGIIPTGRESYTMVE